MTWGWFTIGLARLSRFDKTVSSKDYSQQPQDRFNDFQCIVKSQKFNCAYISRYIQYIYTFIIYKNKLKHSAIGSHTTPSITYRLCTAPQVLKMNFKTWLGVTDFGMTNP